MKFTLRVDIKISAVMKQKVTSLVKQVQQPQVRYYKSVIPTRAIGDWEMEIGRNVTKS